MKKFWKTLVGHRIYQSYEGIEVHQNKLYRWLTFGNDTIQTLVHRNHLEKPGLAYIYYLTIGVRTQPSDCCLLGLGGGGAAHTMSAFKNKAAIVAVEKSNAMIDIAAQYFMTHRISNMHVLHEDANTFVQQHIAQYQHVLVDLYDDNSFPADCNTVTFFSHCRRILCQGGILAVNLVNISKQRTTYEYIRQCFNQSTLCLPVKGTANMIVLAYNGKNVFQLIDLLKHNGCRLRKLFWDAQWGCVAELC